ncbi:MAG: DnaD domain protein [Romboutsia sp.]
MAERRMIAKTIIDSDLFLDMPMSTQCLYFHLNMRADDDGFINNPKKIQRMIGCNDDDIKLLIAKNFIIPFESGVVVIKHWKIHNYIRMDRYKETLYKEEKSQLVTDKSKEYILGRPDDIPLVDQRLTQDRLGKDRLGKDNIPIEEECVNEYVSEKLSFMSKLYQKNIGMANGIVGEWLIDISNQIDVDLFKKALEICTEKGKLNFGYLKGIIKNWLDINITSLEQLQAYELQNNKTSNNSITSKQKNIPATQKQCDDAEFKRRLEESNKLLDSLDENIWGD